MEVSAVDSNREHERDLEERRYLQAQNLNIDFLRSIKKY